MNLLSICRSMRSLAPLFQGAPVRRLHSAGIRLSEAETGAGASMFGSDTKVGDLLKEKGEKIYAIDDDDLVFDAVKKMVLYDVGSLVVVESDPDSTKPRKPTGIVTERDYLQKIVLLGRSSKVTKVKEIMTHSNELISVAPEQTLADCMELMTAKRIRHIPIVTKDGQVRGMISIGDVVKRLVEEYNEEASKLNAFIQGSY